MLSICHVLLCVVGRARRNTPYAAQHTRSCGMWALFAKRAVRARHVVMHCMLPFILEALNGGFYLLEVLEMLEEMCSAFLCMIEAVEGGSAHGRFRTR